MMTVLLCKSKCIMHCIHRTQRILLWNQYCYTNLRCCNHVNIDIFIIQTLKHLCCNTWN